VGLAAPQVGVNQRLLVYNPEGVKGKGVEVVLCNPVLVEASAEQELFEEGCLSFPGIYANIMVRLHLAAMVRLRPLRSTTHKYTLILRRLKPACGDDIS